MFEFSRVVKKTREQHLEDVEFRKPSVRPQLYHELDTNLRKYILIKEMFIKVHLYDQGIAFALFLKDETLREVKRDKNLISSLKPRKKKKTNKRKNKKKRKNSTVEENSRQNEQIERTLLSLFEKFEVFFKRFEDPILNLTLRDYRTTEYWMFLRGF